MLSSQSDGCSDVGKQFADTERDKTTPLAARISTAKEASISKERFITGRFDENCMRDSGVHSVRGSAGVVFPDSNLFPRAIFAASALRRGEAIVTSKLPPPSKASEWQSSEVRPYFLEPRSLCTCP